MTNLPGKIFRHVFLFVAFVSPLFAAGALAPHVTISVDATEAPRKIFHARMTIPAKPGTLLSTIPSGFPANTVPPARFRILPD